MGAADEAAVFQPGQIAPDAGRRGAGDGQQLFYRGGSGAEQEFDDLLGAAIDRVGHLRGDSTLRKTKRSRCFDHFAKKNMQNAQKFISLMTIMA
jgi:hypothetical protein